MSQELYYTPPTQEVFEEMKREAIYIWNTYDNSYGYGTEKINKIKDIENVGDNFMYIFAMFDFENQTILKENISEECRNQIKIRLS